MQHWISFLKNPLKLLFLDLVIKFHPFNRDYVEETLKNLEDFANEGLRTLLLAEKIIPSKEYIQWLTKYKIAITSIKDRDEKVAQVQDEIETELILVGATAIEDKLQDKVPETIYNLKRAGIKIWVLTGDKMETAINIGFSCRLLDNSYEQLIIDGNDHLTIMKKMEELQGTVIFLLFKLFSKKKILKDKRS